MIEMERIKITNWEHCGIFETRLTKNLQVFGNHNGWLVGWLVG